MSPSEIKDTGLVGEEEENREERRRQIESASWFLPLGSLHCDVNEVPGRREGAERGRVRSHRRSSR